ncbi:MAG: NADH-ubiquinone oxidoreductase-F iron-sulfur binding region domain-containing protein [Planctomycetota bacterium]
MSQAPDDRFHPCLLTREPAERPQTLDEYRSEGGYQALEEVMRAHRPEWILDRVDDSGLRGRGGASFPTGRKWRIAAAQPTGEKHVVANGGEHEPGSDKDKHLVRYYPHKVLEGLVLAGYATGAHTGWLYLIEDMAPQLEAARAAIAEMEARGYLGRDVLGTGFSFEIRVHEAPPTYVAGEETAALDSIEGGPGKPREKPPYPGQHGIGGRPTTVNNVETLAHVPNLLRHGAEWYRSQGTEHSRGTMLFTLPSGVRRPGVCEAPFGTTYRELLERQGGGLEPGRELRALLPALSCGFLRAEDLDVQICHEALRELGTSPGCGGIHLVFADEDPVAKVCEIAAFFAREQCGQCPPCRMVTSQLAHVLGQVAAGQPGDFAAHLAKVAEFGRGKGRCSLIAMATAPVLSGVEVFRDDFVARAGG